MPSIINTNNHHLYNPNNERLIKRYKEHRRSAFGADDKTLNSLHSHIRAFEVLMEFQDFTKFDKDTANGFMNKIRTMEMSDSHLIRTTMDTKCFIRWLSHEPEGKKIRYNDADFLNPTKNELRAAYSESFKQSHDYHTLLKVVRNMPAQTVVDRRNRALFALQVLGSFRTNELRNLPVGLLKYDNIAKVHFIDVNPRKVKGVKFRKARQATLFNVPDLVQWITDWIEELKTKYEFTLDDPIFPSVHNTFAEHAMYNQVIQKTPLTTQSVRRIFKDAYIAADVEPLCVHSIRQTKARYIGGITHDDKIVALQQDFGHQNMGTTRCNYGNITPERQRKLMAEVNIDTGE